MNQPPVTPAASKSPEPANAAGSSASPSITEQSTEGLGAVLLSLGPLKTMAIGGIFFLLPVIVIGALIGQVAKIVWTVAVQVNGFLPANNWIGYLVVIALSVALLVLACFLAGFLARRRLARRFNQSLEKYVLMLFPRYTILKEQLTGNIGGDEYRNTLLPVIVQFPGYQRIGFEVERTSQPLARSQEDAAAGEEGQAAVEPWVTVFFPGSPDPWSGTSLLVSHRQVRPLASPFAETVAAFERLGRGSQALLQQHEAGLTEQTF